MIAQEGTWSGAQSWVGGDDSGCHGEMWGAAGI